MEGVLFDIVTEEMLADYSIFVGFVYTAQS